MKKEIHLYRLRLRSRRRCSTRILPAVQVPGSKFKEVVEGEGLTWADEHVIGVAKGVDAEVLQGLKDHFYGRMHRGGHVSGDEPPG